MFWLFIKVFLLLYIVVVVRSDEGLKICLKKLGCLEGIEMPGINGDNFEAFLGVPFAKPPVGNLRFRNPEPVESWQGVLSAREAKPDCKQRNYLMPNWPIMGDEDCLYMNIYRPKDVTDKALPVIFYVYGGGLFSGSSNPGIMGPEYFMDTKEVIVVITTYRLGPFGFLSTGCLEMPGNFGLKDQLLALKWVNENIEAFGGNPHEVTLFGHSAGASSVHFHMLNPKAKDLFKRAILSSGNALAPYVGILENPLEQFHAVAQAVGIDNPQSQSTKELAEKLRSMDADTIVKSGDALKFWFNHMLFNYRPVIEDNHDEQAYLIEKPIDTIRQGNYEMKPWLTGLVSYRGEGAAISMNIYENLTLRQELNQNFADKMLKLLELKSEEQLMVLTKEYMQDKHELNENNADGFQELLSDCYFYYPVYRTLKHYFDFADINKSPVYIYKFSYSGPYSYKPLYTGGVAPSKPYGNVHFDDMLYQFRQSAIYPDFEKDSIDLKLTKEFVATLLEFVKTGKPLLYNDVGSCTMQQFLTSGPNGMCKYMEFINTDNGFERKINNDFHMQRMKLWDQIYKH